MVNVLQKGVACVKEILQIYCMQKSYIRRLLAGKKDSKNWSTVAFRQKIRKMAWIQT
jgi:hypothetical protein